MENKKNLRQVRKAALEYFGSGVKVDIESLSTRNISYATITYDTFRLEEDVKNDLSKIVGDGWSIDVKCSMETSEYLSCLLAEIEKNRLSLIDKLKDRPDFQVWHVNRHCLLELVQTEKLFMETLKRMRYLNEHPEEVAIWDMFSKEKSKFAV